MSGALVIAPHPDDETLGVGGTLFWHQHRGEEIHWLVVTKMDERFDAGRRASRTEELEAVAKAYGFTSVSLLGFPSAQLDHVPNQELVSAIGAVINRAKPDTIFLPFPGDAHTDHAAVFHAAAAATKWFRYPSVKRVLAYETLSETNFGIAPHHATFRPNVFIDISAHIERKLEIMRLYAGEIAAHPFPRSEQAIRALATLRGSEAGCQAAESFMLLKEIAR